MLFICFLFCDRKHLGSLITKQNENQQLQYISKVGSPYNTEGEDVPQQPSCY